MANEAPGPTSHEFVLVLSGVSDLDERVANALFEAGCDDATPSLRFGTVYLAFDRQAATLRDASESFAVVNRASKSASDAADCSRYRRISAGRAACMFTPSVSYSPPT